MDYRALLKLDGIQGETTVAGHIGEIDLMSFSLPEPRGSIPQSNQLKDSTFTKVVDSTTPAIAAACANGTLFQTAVLSLCKAEGANLVDFLLYKMRNVCITSYSVGGSSTGDNAIETVSMNYEAIEYKYLQP